MRWKGFIAEQALSNIRIVDMIWHVAEQHSMRKSPVWSAKDTLEWTMIPALPYMVGPNPEGLIP